MAKFLRSTLIGALISSYSFLATANPSQNASGLEMYVAMCKAATDIPVSDGGESDLKGNAKLDSYCRCFADKFVDRMKKTDPSKVQFADQNIRGEFEMRKVCRAQFGLPAPKPFKS